MTRDDYNKATFLFSEIESLKCLMEGLNDRIKNNIRSTKVWEDKKEGRYSMSQIIELMEEHENKIDSIIMDEIIKLEGQLANL